MLNWFISLRCPDCGAKITEDEKYCPNCGVDLEAPLGQDMSGAEFRSGKSKADIAPEYLNKAQKDYDRGRRLNKALSNCEIALQYNPESADAHNLRGLILDALGQKDDALNSYKEALRLDPNHEDAKENLDDAKAELLMESQEGIVDNLNKPKNYSWLKIIIWLVMMVFGIVFVLSDSKASSYFRPKITVVFAPDYSKIASVNLKELVATAQILTERSHNLGHSEVSFVVNDEMQIIGKILSYEDVNLFVSRINKIGLLELVDFGANPAPEGSIVITDHNDNTGPAEGQKMHTVMTNNEIERAFLSENQFGDFQVSFTLTSEGTKILADYSAKNTGKYLGIVLDKVVVSVPIIRDKISDGQGLITGKFTKEQAEDLTTILNTKPLLIPLILIHIQ